MLRFLILVALTGCQIGLAADSAGGKDLGNGSGSGSGQPPAECVSNSDCVLAGVKCCDCPTFAVPKTDPAHKACTGITCPPSSCSQNVRAECATGRCVLTCAPMACSTSCADGYALDGTGCLTCACAVPVVRQCSLDGDCAEVRADCCGCKNGGADTAVPQSQVASHDAALNCPANPSCPAVNTCVPNLAPRCVQGTCDLIGGLPPNACGRPDLPACSSSEVCMVNANATATKHGLGICTPP